MNDLEQKIKDSFDEVSIKTTSNDILNEYRMNKKKKTSFSWNRKWTVALSSFACLLILIPILIIRLSPNNDQSFEIVNTASELTDDSVLNTLSVELLCGKSFDQKTSNTRRLLSSVIQLDNDEKDEEETSDFETIVEQFHPVSNTVISLLESQAGIASSFKKVEFEYQGKSYQYAFISGEDTIYLNTNLSKHEEAKAEVLVLLNDNYYQGNLEYKINQNKLEMELSYQREDTFITIKKETKNNKYELSYSEKTSNSEIEYEIELEYKQGKMYCEYEYEANEQELEIEIYTTGNQTYFITGEEIEITLTVADQQKIYECEGKMIKK